MWVHLYFGDRKRVELPSGGVCFLHESKCEAGHQLTLEKEEVTWERVKA